MPCSTMREELVHQGLLVLPSSIQLWTIWSEQTDKMRSIYPFCISHPQISCSLQKHTNLFPKALPGLRNSTCNTAAFSRFGLLCPIQYLWQIIVQKTGNVLGTWQMCWTSASALSSGDFRTCFYWFSCGTERYSFGLVICCCKMSFFLALNLLPHSCLSSWIYSRKIKLNCWMPKLYTLLFSLTFMLKIQEHLNFQ
jgi:hypothetical protein